MTRHEIFHNELLPQSQGLKKFAFKLTNDSDDAQDLYQNTMLSAWRFTHKFQPGSNAKSWMFTIMRNCFVNDYRKVKKMANDVSLDEDISGDYAAKEVKYSIGDEISNLLDKMPTENRALVVMCLINDYSYEEACAILDIPLGTIRSKLHRARVDLRVQLKDYAKSFGYK